MNKHQTTARALTVIVVMSSLPILAQQSPTVTIPADTDLCVKMTTALSSKLNKPGDSISGVVVSPEQFKGATVEGEIKNAKSGGKVNKTSTLDFAFQTIQFQGKVIPISAQVKSVVNSKGKENVDEEGHIVEKKGNTGKLAAITGAGALIGGLAGGGKGAAFGAGVGALASLVVIKYGVKGPEIRFDLARSSFSQQKNEQRPVRKKTAAELQERMAQFGY